MPDATLHLKITLNYLQMLKFIPFFLIKLKATLVLTAYCLITIKIIYIVTFYKEAYNSFKNYYSYIL